jgi:predicted NBD/HSP70 family sugar kinase/biotin operon repressor
VTSPTFPGSGFSEGTRSVFIELLLHGPLSRADLARRLGLSSSALTKLTRPLLEDGYLTTQSGSGRAAVGRPSQPLQVNASRLSFIGVKLTDSEVFAVRIDLAADIHDKITVALPGQGVADVIACIAQAVDHLTAAGPRPAHLGISLAGTAQRGDPVVHRSPFLGWSQVPLAELVTAATGLPTVLENDVRALTAAQQWFGVGVKHAAFTLITVGAGIGCGLVVGRALVSGPSGTGLVGHLAIDDRGPLCERGHRGCARAYATAPAIRRSIASTLDRADLDFDGCIELARQGDPVASRVFADAGRALGQVVATVANIAAPEVAVLSGEGVHMYEVCAEAFHEALNAHTHWTSTPVHIDVQPFTFDEWARGAGVIALQQHLAPS